jgi:hypothetical protein
MKMRAACASETSSVSPISMLCDNPVTELTATVSQYERLKSLIRILLVRNLVSDIKGGT